jgi:hypothetical protein
VPRSGTPSRHPVATEETLRRSWVPPPLSARAVARRPYTEMDRGVWEEAASASRPRWGTWKGKDGPRSVGRGAKPTSPSRTSLVGSGSLAPRQIVRRANRTGCSRTFVS